MKVRDKEYRPSLKKEKLAYLIYRKFARTILLSTLGLMAAALLVVSVSYQRSEQALYLSTTTLTKKVFESFFQTMLSEHTEFFESVERLASMVRVIEERRIPESEKDQLLLANLMLPSSILALSVERMPYDSLRGGLLEKLEYSDYYIFYSFGKHKIFVDIYLKLPTRVVVIHLVKDMRGIENVGREIVKLSNLPLRIKGFGLYRADLQPLIPEALPLSSNDRAYLTKAMESGESIHVSRSNLHTIYTVWSCEGRHYGFEPVGIVIQTDLTPFNLLMLSLILFFGVTIAVFVLFMLRRSKTLSSQIAQPFERLVESMNRFKDAKFLELDGDLANCGIVEVDGLTQTYRELAEEVMSSFEEIKAMNEELQDSYQKLQQLHEELESTYEKFARQLAVIAEGYDEVTGNHIERVGILSGFIARKLGLKEDVAIKLEHFAPLHDIGKIMVDKRILNKPDRLTDEEFEEMKKHTIYGAALLGEDKYFEMARTIALYHHEKWNGRGYPFGLKGDEIPIEAAIVALVDVYDALRSQRPYKKAFSHEQAVEILKKGDDKTRPDDFNPEVLKVFLEHELEIRSLWDNVKSKGGISTLKERIQRLAVSGGVEK